MSARSRSARVELAGALAPAFGERAEQVLVGAAEDVRLGVRAAEAVAVDGLDQGVEAVVVEGLLAGLGLVEVADVDGAVELGVERGDLPHGGGDELAEAAVGEVVADGVPVVLWRHEEADDRGAAGFQGVLVVGADDLPGGLLVAEGLDLLGEAVGEDVGEALEEDEGRMKSLNLGASAVPRTAQAASQSQVSRAGVSRCSLGSGTYCRTVCCAPLVERRRRSRLVVATYPLPAPGLPWPVAG